MINKFYILFLVLIISLVFLGNTGSEMNKSENRFLRKNIPMLEKKYNLRSSTLGGGASDNLINDIFIGFDYDDSQMSVNKARELIVNLTEDFLNAVNSDEDLRPHLRDYPFSTWNTLITIFFVDKDDNEILSPHLITVDSRMGKISYGTNEIKGNSIQLNETKEDYFEALKKIKGTGN